MIEAQDFVEAARGQGFAWYAGVPCSFLTPFINCVIGDPHLTYISSANEGDAVAAAAGAASGGQRPVVMIQNSGLGNAVSPLTSLTWVFRIPLLLICTHRGAPDVHDEPQHELMGRITGDLLDTMEVPWETFPTERSEVAAALTRASDHMERERRPYAFVMAKGSVAPHQLDQQRVARASTKDVTRIEAAHSAQRPSRSEALQRVLQHTPETGSVVIATTGYTGRELYALADRANQLYMVGSMGCASSFALGLSLARPDLKIVVVDGDGAALMRMGNLATIGAYGGGNLVHIVLDNEAHDSTGGQATVSGNVSFATIALACGYGAALDGADVELIDELFAAPPSDRSRFAHLKIRTGTLDQLPRPSVSPSQVLQRLMKHIGSSFFKGNPELL